MTVLHLEIHFWRLYRIAGKWSCWWLISLVEALLACENFLRILGSANLLTHHLTLLDFIQKISIIDDFDCNSIFQSSCLSFVQFLSFFDF